ncbi:MAG: VOC family protein [Chloroflexota bacterium]
MGQPVAHFEIMGSDPAKLQRFYAEVFGWNVGAPAAEMGNYSMVDGASSGLAGGIGQDQGGAPRVTLYIQVPNLQAALDLVVAHGGRVAMPPTEIPGGPSIAQFTDPGGNLTGLLQG